MVTDSSNAEIPGLGQAVDQEASTKLLCGCEVHWSRSWQQIRDRVASSSDKLREKAIFAKFASQIMQLQVNCVSDSFRQSVQQGEDVQYGEADGTNTASHAGGQEKERCRSGEEAEKTEAEHGATDGTCCQLHVQHSSTQSITNITDLGNAICPQINLELCIATNFPQSLSMLALSANITYNTRSVVELLIQNEEKVSVVSHTYEEHIPSAISHVRRYCINNYYLVYCGCPTKTGPLSRLLTKTKLRACCVKVLHVQY